MNRKVISKILAQYGVEVAALASGAKAVETLMPPHDMDCVLMDIQVLLAPFMLSYSLNHTFIMLVIAALFIASVKRSVVL